MSEPTFRFLKGAILVAAFAVAALLQSLYPHSRSRAAIVSNWRVNLPLAAINSLVAGVLCGGCACVVSGWAALHRFGAGNWLAWPPVVRIVLAVLSLDLTAYLWHRANHRLRLLWRFHAVHHSDRVFDVSTAYRFHPGEVLAALPVRLAVVAALGLSVSGILAFELLYGVANAFEHSNTCLGRRLESWLAAVVVTPALHRRHHRRARRADHRNFATIFTVWDRAFGTYAAATSDDRVEVGLAGRAEAVRERSVLDLLCLPLARDPSGGP